MIENLPKSALYWLAAAIVLASAPHFEQLPIWVSLLLPAAIGLRLALPGPPWRWVLIALVIMTFAAIIAQFGAISGPDAGGAFFTAMVALKFLESRNVRDGGLLVCLAYFQITTIFLYSEAIGMTAYVLVSLAVTTMTLVTLASPRASPPPRTRLRVSATLLLQAVPIMLVLFVLFPRIPGPLWGMHDDEQAITGLSDSMSPGEITDLAQSDEVAFRVEFDDESPAPQYHYWRGPVFTSYDGRTWREGDAEDGEWRDAPPPLEEKSEPIAYTLTLEAHQQRWLFALDLPVAELPGRTELNGVRQLLTENTIRSTRRFDLRSALEYRFEPELVPERRRESLALPEETAPRTRELAEELREQAGADDTELVERALAWFRAGDFEYTLRPQRLDGDSADQFLFETRSGFCEHFASAFTILMRAAEIPARVVTGYLGSEAGTVGDYYIVRQSHAHAWVEVWLPERGWVRVDPTATVSPDRIDLGLDGIPGSEGSGANGAGRDRLLSYRLAMTWDAVNHGWNRFVLGYGPDLQERLMERLGLEGLGRYALGVIGIAISGLVLAAIWFLGRGGDRPRDAIDRAWRDIERRLARIGWPRKPGEGVFAHCHRIANARPDLATDLIEIADLHDRLRYQPEPDPATRQRFLKAARHFHPPRDQVVLAASGERPAGR